MTMPMKSLVLAALALSACTDDTTEDDPNATGDTGAEECTSGIVSVFPDESDADSIYYRSNIEIEFKTDESDSASFTLADSEGNAVSLSEAWSEDGLLVVLQPEPLMPSTDYTLDVSYSCDKSAELDFTTSDIGGPVDGGPESLVDKVYRINLQSARITTPPGVGDLLMGFIPTDLHILVSPNAYDSGSQELSMTGALGKGDGSEQDECVPSIDFPVPAAFDEDPYFEISATELPLTVAGFTLTLNDVLLAGSFASDASSIEGLTLAGSADLRELDIPDFDLDCDTIEVIAPGACVECDDGVKACLDLVLDSMVADHVSDAGLVLITEDDIAENPSCETEEAPEQSAE